MTALIGTDPQNLQEHPLTATPLTENCAQVFNERQHALVGISPFNGFFTHRRVLSIMEWAMTHFDSMDVLIPGKATANTLIALGYSVEEAKARARRRLHRTETRAMSCLRELHIKNPQRKLHSIDELSTTAAYQDLSHQIDDAFHTEKGFHDGCLEASRLALKTYLPEGTEPTYESLNTAVTYHLAELPIMIDSPAIFDVKSSVMFYPKAFPLAESLYKHTLGLSASAHQGYVIVDC